MKIVKFQLECYSIIEVFNKIRDFVIKQVQEGNRDCIDGLLYWVNFDSNEPMEFLEEIHRSFATDVFPKSFVVEFPNPHNFSLLVCDCDVTIIQKKLYESVNGLSTKEVDELLKVVDDSENTEPPINNELPTDDVDALLNDVKDARILGV